MGVLLAGALVGFWPAERAGAQVEVRGATITQLQEAMSSGAASWSPGTASCDPGSGGDALPVIIPASPDHAYRRRARIEPDKRLIPRSSSFNKTVRARRQCQNICLDPLKYPRLDPHAVEIFRPVQVKPG